MDEPSDNAPRRFEKITQVSHRVGFKKSWIYNEISHGRFPRPLKIHTSARFDSRAIDRWIEQQVEDQRERPSPQRSTPPPVRLRAPGDRGLPSGGKIEP